MNCNSRTQYSTVSDEMRKTDVLYNIHKVTTSVTPSNRIRPRLIRRDKDDGTREKDVKNLIGSVNGATWERHCIIVFTMDTRLGETETRTLRSIHYSSGEASVPPVILLAANAKQDRTSYSGEKRSSRQPLHVNSLMSTKRMWNISRKLAYEIRNATVL